MQGVMAAGADTSVVILDDHHLLETELPPGPGQQLQLGPPLRDPDATMPLLEFDCGPLPAAPVAPQPAPLLDHMAPLPDLPPVGDITSTACGVPTESVSFIECT